MSLGNRVVVHRKLAADEQEAGSCFYCYTFIHKGDRYAMIVAEVEPCPDTDENKMAVGICLDCAKKIGKAARLVEKGHSQQKPKKDIGERYELAEWEQLAKGEKKQFRNVSYQIRGPLENVVVVVPDAESLPQEHHRRNAAMRNLQTVAEDALQKGGWTGEVIVIPSDIKLMRLRKKDTQPGEPEKL